MSYTSPYSPYAHVPLAVMGPGVATSTKMTLGPGMTADLWESIFGAGTADAVESRGERLSPYDAWARVAWLRRCADARAKAVQSLPWAIYRQEDRLAEGAPLWRSDDVSAPDELEALADLPLALYLAEASLSLSGQAYFGKIMREPSQSRPGAVGASLLGRLEGLRYWSPLSVSPQYGPAGLSAFRRTVGGRAFDVDPEAVVWIFQPDPFREVGPGTADADAAGAPAAALDALARFLGRHLDSGLIKMTVLGVEGHTTADQRSELKSLWNRLLRRGAKRGGAPVLSGTVKPHTIGEGLKDIHSDELTSSQRADICAAMGVPESLLTSSAANYATAAVEERGFYLRTVIPQARLVQRAFNRCLMETYGLALVFEPERHEVMQQYELEKAEKVAVICGGAVLTRDEGRELLGYRPSGDGLPQAAGTGDEPSGDAPSGDGVEMRSVAGSVAVPGALPVLSLEDRIARIVGEGR